MEVTRVVFIRTGETDWNRAGRQMGWAAAPLNVLGKRQVEKLANFVRNIGVRALYSSDLRRAAQTAEILAERLGAPPVFDERLRERSIGVWQGLTLDEIREWHPEDYAQLREQGDDYRIPGGESRQDVAIRMRAAFDEILAQGTGETIAIVSHTTAIRMLLRGLIPNADVQFSDLTNSSVTTIERTTEGGWRVTAADDTLHLEGMESKSVREPEDKS